MVQFLKSTAQWAWLVHRDTVDFCIFNELFSFWLKGIWIIPGSVCALRIVCITIPISALSSEVVTVQSGGGSPYTCTYCVQSKVQANPHTDTWNSISSLSANSSSLGLPKILCLFD